MPLDSDGKAMIAQQVKHHHNRLKLITSIKLTLGFFYKTLVGLRWMPDDEHEASK